MAALLLVLASLANVGVATPTNDPPLVDAGLDQTVERNTRVALDGTGTRDPDGRVVSYRWRVETPDGRTTAPANATAARTSFTPSRLGRYEVTLTAVDDDGGRRSDTLYVDVTRGDDPTVTVSGPDRTTLGSAPTYRAAVSRGTAPLREIVWRVDGEVAARREITADDRDALTASFAAAGAHEVSATVVDADELTASDDRTVDVRRDDDDDGSSDSTGGGTSTIAERRDPAVRGTKLFTGRGPFGSTYRLTNVGNSVRSVQWFTDRTRGSRTRHPHVTWTPGDHQIHAVVRYTDGSRDTATFRDGSTEVVVDPMPEISFPSLDGRDGVSGRALASDGYANLRSIEIEVDGRTVERWPERNVGSRGHLVSERAVGFAVPGARVNQNHTVTVTAVDARGQRAHLSRDVTVSGQPEIVSSEFVDDPVDAYHERLDPERYAAKHVLKIDLNGVPKEEVDWSYRSGESQNLQRLTSTRYGTQTDYDPSKDIFTVTTHWFGKVPNTYLLDSQVKAPNYHSNEDWGQSKLVVRNSPPELRLDIRPQRHPHQATEWDVVVDAGSSFDPDGNSLEYLWKKGAKPVSADNTTAIFSALQFATLVLRDGEGQTTRKDFDYLRYIVPSIRDVEVVSDGPYRPNGTVKLNVNTIDYTLSKNSYSIDLGVGVEGTNANTIEWKRYRRNPDDVRRIRYWKGTLEIPASEFLDSESEKVHTYNEKRPGDTTDGHSIPEVTVLTGVETRYSDVSVQDLRYLVEKPVVDRVRLTSKRQRTRYLIRGYEIDSKETETEYLIKEPVKVTDAQYERRRKGFSTASTRRLFVNANSEWEIGGSDTETKTETVHDTEWRSDRGGKGTFTGKTRRVQTSPAEYRTKKKYRYTREEEHTRRRTITYWDTVTREKTYTKRIRKCLRFGCYYTTQTYTREVTDRVQRSYVDTYTYTTTETETYWAFSKHIGSHEFTGDTRRVKVADAEYETQYEYEFDRTVERNVRTYYASRRVKIRPARYDWRVTQTFDSALRAYKRSLGGSKRLESRTTVNSWTMSKRMGTSKEISSTYEDESNVLETRATLAGTRTVRGIDPQSGDYRVIEQSPFQRSISTSGVSTRQELRNSITDEDDRNCEDVRARYRRECSALA